MALNSAIETEEREELRRAYKRLLVACGPMMEKDDIGLIRKALNITAAHDAGVARNEGGELKVIEAIEVALVVVNELGLSRIAVIGALLYDAVLNGAVTSDEVESTFGKQVALITRGLVKVGELYNKNTSIENDNFRKLLLTFAEDIRVVLLIIANRLRTMRMLALYSAEDQQRISSEVAYLYAPMAHRLGLYNIKSEMEDLVMKFTNREMYSFIAKKLNETKRARDKYIREFIEPLEQQLKKQGLKFEIKGRTKTIHSIYNKIKKQNTEFENVYDLFAIRVILDSELEKEKAECWQVYSVVTDKYQPNPSRLRDWISVPKSNGYESLHTTVLGPENKWVEVQIRTERMNEVAEKGLAAHWKYKGHKGEKGMDEWLSNVREILENPELNAVDFIDDFKLDLYDEEVFVFTPKGDLRRLKKGATVLDFAFEIHSEVGKKCIGGRVNNKNVPIKYQLQNGDHVDIQTANNQAPKKDWLNIVVTSKAKSKLKQALRDIEYKEAELGREMLIRRLKNWKYELNDQLLNLMVKGFGYKTVQDFMRSIAIDKIDFSRIKEFIINLEKKEEEGTESDKERSAENFVTGKEDLPDDDVLMIDKSLTNVDYKLAKCCNPIFGDDIFGFVASMGGIKIHRRTCPNALDMHTKFGYRIVKAQWTSGSDANYQATLKITGVDDIGIVTNISQVISKEMKIKIRSMAIDSHEGIFEGTLTVFVDNTNSLTTLIKKIKNIKGVYTVSRVGA
ncbi:bifunctional (p)ppGpp synthetase/guanosine-3',5'-bis(diphosphate) 3'-pyrophosphohydrolase [Carboxylicivirga sediminis]|uniref:Bifunctional (P)ppGpp synthetase/guanosine-3',5'-bis(Diphosphate) 3'-pyrophosphohydrolase n=1 Tax=Carboxylicivirga sediminis TaxID=2006564 RepID=A0A941F1N0_9BACT|nr:RelA/SpoT family protein [Carboxylicivirga sediminis]MBR8534533.1 bifunctional (p)ppGpp synthetase/guanosine-3',5'-bis(diphosphate) 3'-pyrophosphohydrolase [Carboxylicivirga sediminis]